MWGLEELKGHRETLDRIDWEMTPEKAVETFPRMGDRMVPQGGVRSLHWPGVDLLRDL